MGKEGKLIEARPCPGGPSGTTRWPVCMRLLLASARQEATPLLPGHVPAAQPCAPHPMPHAGEQEGVGRVGPAGHRHTGGSHRWKEQAEVISGLRALLPGFLPPSAGGYTGHLQKFCCVVFSCSVVRCQLVHRYI